MTRRVRLAILAATILLGACDAAGVPGATAPNTAATPSAAATRHPFPDATGTLAHDGPILEATSLPGGTQFFNPSAAILADGTYHLYGFAVATNTGQAMQLVSTDGTSWTVGPDPDWQPLGEALGLAPPGPITTTLLVADDGTWVAYGWGFLPGANPAPTVGWRATAPGPDGPWTSDPGVIVEPGAGDAWDGRGIFGISVMRDGAGYRAAYAASSRLFPNHGLIGMGTSADGSAWTKYDRPTAERRLAESDPIVEPGLCGDYDAGAVFGAQIAAAETGYRLLYSGFTVGVGPSTIARATSSDGETWSCDGAAVTESLFPGTARIAGFVQIMGDEEHLIVEAQDETGTTSALWLVRP